jgi:hypothetical protein
MANHGVFYLAHVPVLVETDADIGKNASGEVLKVGRPVRTYVWIQQTISSLNVPDFVSYQTEYLCWYF